MVAATAAAAAVGEKPLDQTVADCTAITVKADSKRDTLPDGGRAEKDFTPPSAADYQQPAYWDARFAEEDNFEWCKDWSAFSHLVLPHVKPTDAILELGCGNSSMALAMAGQHGCQNITCTDLSATVVDRMQAKADAQGLPIHYQVANMLDLPFGAGSFDVVMEKGVLDIFTATEGYDPWNPPEEIRSKIASVLAGVHRVLRPGGVFISITFAQPHFRLPLLLSSRPKSWAADSPGRFGDSFHYFVYVLHRQDAEAAATVGEGASEGGNQREWGVDAQPFGGLVVRSREPDEEGAMHEHMDQEDYLLAMSL